MPHLCLCKSLDRSLHPHGGPYWAVRTRNPKGSSETSNSFRYIINTFINQSRG